jgi:hypothetical protein
VTPYTIATWKRRPHAELHTEDAAPGAPFPLTISLPRSDHGRRRLAARRGPWSISSVVPRELDWPDVLSHLTWTRRRRVSRAAWNWSLRSKIGSTINVGGAGDRSRICRGRSDARASRIGASARCRSSSVHEPDHRLRTAERDARMRGADARSSTTLHRMPVSASDSR